jgi:hypothetical protein
VRKAALGDRLRGETLNRPAREQDFALVWPVEAADHVECCRLAGPVGADEAHELAFVDSEIESLDRSHPAEPARQTANFQKPGHA